MVQNVEPFNVSVIKVTIKDKPDSQDKQRPTTTAAADEHSLKLSFEALRQFALQERRLRQLGATLDERSRQRRLRRFFAAWQERTSRRGPLQPPVSHERKIELLVSAVAAEQQREAARAENQQQQPPSCAEMQQQQQRRRRGGSNMLQRSTLGGPVDGGSRKRLDAQKAVIEEQRARLAEQGRLIQELKLREVEQEAKRTSQQTLKVARQALSHCDVRTRRSIVHLMREQGCRDKSVVEVPRMPSPPDFLTRMEARAEARKETMKEIEQLRKRKREEQRRREEARQREAEELQRQQQLQALKETRKVRKEQEERRRKELEKNMRLEQTADKFYKRYLFRRYALEPLTSLVEVKKEHLEKADRHYAKTLLTRVFLSWKSEWLEQQLARLQLANKFYRHSLLWYAFEDWRAFVLGMKQKCQVAVDFYEMKLQVRCIRRWQQTYVEAKRMEHEKQTKAVKHHERVLKTNYFDLWKKYMLIADDIKEREHRRDEWRDLIRRFIPENHKLQRDYLHS